MLLLGGGEFDDICIPLDTIPECDGQTDRQTGGFALTVSCSACKAC